MLSSTVPPSLQQLAARLPFGLDDTEQVGEAFLRWQTRPPGTCDAAERGIVVLWTYCFVHRYFRMKLSSCPASAASDLDELVARAHRKVEEGRPSVREPRRYPNWVSVVCKNTFRNYLRRGALAAISLHEEHSPPLRSADRVGDELGLAEEVVERAVERLPDYLQPVARLRLLEGHSYKVISEKTGTPVPTARSYAGRARARLREDPLVRRLLH